jgi:FG-GAP repeat
MGETVDSPWSSEAMAPHALRTLVAGAILSVALLSAAALPAPEPVTVGSTLAPASIADGDGLGWAVAFDGDTAGIGAVFHANAGSVFVLRKSGTTWSEEQELSAAAPQPGSWLGAAVAISGDTLVAGAPFEDEGGASSAGAVHVFVRSGTTWSLEQRLAAPDASQGGQLGTSVAIDGDTLVAGSLDQLARGSAYVFARSGSSWSLQQKPVASGGATSCGSATSRPRSARPRRSTSRTARR